MDLLNLASPRRPTGPTSPATPAAPRQGDARFSNGPVQFKPFVPPTRATPRQPVYTTQQIQDYILNNGLGNREQGITDPRGTYDAARRFGVSASQLDAAQAPLGVRPGATANYIRDQGWTPLSGDARLNFGNQPPAGPNRLTNLASQGLMPNIPQPTQTSPSFIQGPAGSAGGLSHGPQQQIGGGGGPVGGQSHLANNAANVALQSQHVQAAQGPQQDPENLRRALTYQRMSRPQRMIGG